MVGKVLAIMDYMKRNPETCTKLLAAHRENNTESRRKILIRTLQKLNALPEDVDSDELLEEEDLLDPTINVFNIESETDQTQE